MKRAVHGLVILFCLYILSFINYFIRLSRAPNLRRGVALKSSESPFKTKICATIEINGEPLQMQVDPGATCNVIPDKHVPPETVTNKTKQKLTM